MLDYFFFEDIEYRKQKSKLNPQTYLMNFFHNRIEWLVDSNNHYDKVLKLLETFIKDTFLSKRGTGQYNNFQLLLAEKISTALHEGKLVIFATRSKVSKDPAKPRGW